MKKYQKPWNALIIENESKTLPSKRGDPYTIFTPAVLTAMLNPDIIIAILLL